MRLSVVVYTKCIVAKRYVRHRAKVN